MAGRKEKNGLTAFFPLFSRKRTTEGRGGGGGRETVLWLCTVWPAAGPAWPGLPGPVRPHHGRRRFKSCPGYSDAIARSMG